MKKTKTQSTKSFPEVITQLPSAAIQVEGARAWVLQSEASQLVFFEFKGGTKVREHHHDYPQWGLVVSGRMELVVNGEPWMCEKGAEYVVPAGAKHFARFLVPTRVMDYFSERSRYKTKTANI